MEYGFRKLLSEKAFLQVAKRARKVNGVAISEILYNKDKVIIKCNSVSRPGLRHTVEIQIQDLVQHRNIQAVKENQKKSNHLAAEFKRSAREAKDPLAGRRLEKVIADSPLKVFCSCESFTYWGYKYIGWRRGYGIYKETRRPKVRNPHQKGYLCLDGDTLVITPLGEKRLSQIQVGDLVLTGKGRFKRVTARSVTESVKTFRIKLGTTSLIGSAEHPILSGRNKRTTCKTYKSWWDVKYRALDDIIPGDCAFSPGISEFGTEVVDENLAWFLGLYVGDGSLHHVVGNSNSKRKLYVLPGRWKSINIAFDRKYEKVYRELFKQHRIPIHRIIYTNTQTAQIVVNDFRVVDFCVKFGRFTNNKHGISKQLPAAVFWSRKAKDALLRGFYLADGTIVPGSGAGNSYITFYNTNYQVVSQLAMLVSKTHQVRVKFYDRNPFVQNNRVVKPKRMYWFRLTGPDAEEFYNQSRLETEAKSFSGNHNFGKVGFTESEFGRVIPITAKESAGKRTVYNIQVEDDETFVANGVITHNCKHLYCVLHMWPLLAKTVARRMLKNDPTLQSDKS